MAAVPGQLPAPMTAAAAAAALAAMPVPGNLDSLIAGAQPLGLSGAAAVGVGRPPLPPGSMIPTPGPFSMVPVPGSRLPTPGGFVTPVAAPRPMSANGQQKPMTLVRQIRKELISLEEEVPWTAVDVSKWRGARKNWQKRVRSAEQPRELGGAMLELHDALLTDKMSGVFASGGLWELAAQELAEGGGGDVLLQRVWFEMRSAMHRWLADRAGSGGSLVDRGSYEAATRAYRALAAAAAEGPEALDQVPLECLLANPIQLSVLQSLLAKETAGLQARLAVLAAGGGAVPGGEGGLSDGLSQKRGPGPDTDADDASDATDLGDEWE